MAAHRAAQTPHSTHTRTRTRTKTKSKTTAGGSSRQLTMCSDRSRRRAGAAWRGVSTAQIRLHARAPRLAISHRRNDYFIRFYQISDLVYGSTYFLVGIVRIRTRRVDFSRELDSRAPRKTMLGANLRRPNCRLSFGKLHTRARAVARKGA